MTLSRLATDLLEPISDRLVPRLLEAEGGVLVAGIESQRLTVALLHRLVESTHGLEREADTSIYKQSYRRGLWGGGEEVASGEWRVTSGLAS